MKLKKYSKITFIENGNQISRNIIYNDEFYGIPLFVSSGIDSNIVITTNDGETFIVSMVEIEKVKKDLNEEIDIVNKLLSIQFDDNSEHIRLIHLAKWYGFSNVMNYVRQKYDKEKASELNSVLNNVFSRNINLDMIPDKNTVLGNIKKIEII